MAVNLQHQGSETRNIEDFWLPSNAPDGMGIVGNNEEKNDQWETNCGKKCLQFVSFWAGSTYRSKIKNATLNITYSQENGCFDVVLAFFWPSRGQYWTHRLCPVRAWHQFLFTMWKPKTHESLVNHFMFCVGIRIICSHCLQNCKGFVSQFGCEWKTMEG